MLIHEFYDLLKLQLTNTAYAAQIQQLFIRWWGKMPFQSALNKADIYCVLEGQS